jgi:hypothetical protein
LFVFSKRKPTSGKKATLPSLAVLARRINPFDDSKLLLKRLELETSESRYLEWKLTPPFGPLVTKKIKYRMVKAIISFANTDGGFVVFGVDPAGKWVGLTETEVEQTDAAMIGDIVNECINPELSVLNYGLLSKRNRIFPVVHVPPSQLMPHVTTKEIVEKLSDGRLDRYINRHAVYCRYSAKSDLATATQYARIIAQRTDMLRTEMLRVVKKIDVPTQVPPQTPVSVGRPLIQVSRLTDDQSVPAIRVTRNPAEATGGTVVYEKLSQAVFSEINHVLAANRLLAPDADTFIMGENIYYRIYAERQHVDPDDGLFSMLLRAAFKFYGPSLFWLLRLPPHSTASIIKTILENPHSTQMYLVCRIAVLLGRKVTDWLMDVLQKQWGSHPQPPNHYFTFKNMRENVEAGDDVRLVALQQSSGSRLKSLPESDHTISKLAADKTLAANLLSKTCMAVFSGETWLRSACRHLDILTHGGELVALRDPILDELTK